jgi:hypothetical protein
MARLEPTSKLARGEVIAGLLLASGLALVAWSFIWTSVSGRPAGWSQEQAREYQAASAKLHGLSHEYVHESERGNEGAVRAELEQAQAEYDVLRGQLESAMHRPRRIALVMRFGGLLLIVIGAVSLYFGRSSNRHQHR